MKGGKINSNPRDIHPSFKGLLIPPDDDLKNFWFQNAIVFFFPPDILGKDTFTTSDFFNTVSETLGL